MTLATRRRCPQHCIPVQAADSAGSRRESRQAPDVGKRYLTMISYGIPVVRDGMRFKGGGPSLSLGGLRMRGGSSGCCGSRHPAVGLAGTAGQSWHVYGGLRPAGACGLAGRTVSKPMAAAIRGCVAAPQATHEKSSARRALFGFALGRDVARWTGVPCGAVRRRGLGGRAAFPCCCWFP